MSDCKYSIIPTPKKELYCSTCGKKMEGIPYYSQIDKLFTCIDSKDKMTFYVGLGLAVPKCDDCDYDVTEKIENTEKRYEYLRWICIAAFFIIICVFRNGVFSPILIIIFILMLIIHFNRDKLRENSITNNMTSHGMDIVKPATDFLLENGWHRTLATSDKVRDYSEGSLKLDLDKICGDGKFCILNNETGYIVDYKDYETLKEIYEGSRWVCQEK